MTTDGVFFDLDGTLWDSCGIVAKSWAGTLRGRGLDWRPTAAELRGIMGMNFEQITAALFSRFGARAPELCRACIDEENTLVASEGGLLYPGTGDMLAALSARLPLFIVSNCQDGYIQAFLENTGFGPFFRDFACEGMTGQGKAENLALLIERHGLRAPVYVGDTEGDERSARQAGCRFIHASYGFGAAAAPDAVIGSPAELCALLGEEEEQHV